MSSLAVRLADMSEADRKKLLARLSDEEKDALLYDWVFWARPEQLYPKGDWTVWLLLGGRGAGKTVTGAQTVRMWAETKQHIHLVGATAADLRDVMIEGPAGILAVYPKAERPEYEPSKRRITWPNGCVARLSSADEPDRLRGVNAEVCWCDELGAWRFPDDAWTQMLLGTRLGDLKILVTTTPRPIPLLKSLIVDKRTHLTRMTTFENLDNLAATFQDAVLSRYEGTTIGRQELYAEMVEDVEGALWTRATIEANRVSSTLPLQRIVVGVDPPGSATGAECGIVGAGVDNQEPPHYYVLDDRSLHGSPDTWGNESVACYRTLKADRIIGERNFGGDMVESTIRTVDPDVSYRDVVSSRGKLLRAEPVAALAEQGRLHHVGTFGSLEDEQCSYDGSGPSPNRMDAMVFAVTELMERGSMKAEATVPTRRLMEAF